MRDNRAHNSHTDNHPFNSYARPFYNIQLTNVATLYILPIIGEDDREKCQPLKKRLIGAFFAVQN